MLMQMMMTTMMTMMIMIPAGCAAPLGNVG